MNRDDILSINGNKLYDNGIVSVHSFKNYPNQHSVMVLEKYFYLGAGIAKKWATADFETINSDYEKMIGASYNELNPAVPITELQYALREACKLDR